MTDRHWTDELYQGDGVSWIDGVTYVVDGVTGEGVVSLHEAHPPEGREPDGPVAHRILVSTKDPKDSFHAEVLRLGHRIYALRLEQVLAEMREVQREREAGLITAAEALNKTIEIAGRFAGWTV